MCLRCLGLLTWILVLVLPAFAQAPRIDSVTPSQGPITGGTPVTLSGSNLAGAALSLDGAPIMATAASPTQIRFTTPAHDSGVGSLRVTTSSGTAYGEFLYVPPPLADLPKGYITTVAGVGRFNGEYRPATQAEVHPNGNPAFDAQGNLYIAEPGNNRVVRVRSDGILEPFAGNGRAAPSGMQDIGDGGPAAEARVNFARSVATDGAGNVYIADGAPRVRKVDARTGIITTIAGNGLAGFSGDGGPATQARLIEATHIAADRAGTLWFIDFDSVTRAGRIRRVTPDGIITTIAGTGSPGFSGDGGPATAAQFNFLFGDNGSLALDPQGNLFVADVENSRVRRIDARSGIITTFHGPVLPEAGRPLAVAADISGNVYVSLGTSIRKLDPSGRVAATYGKGLFGGHSPDGTPIGETYLNYVVGLTVDASNNVVFSDHALRVRRLNFSTGLVETLAGIAPQVIGETGPATATVLRSSGEGAGLAFLPNGDLLAGDAHFLIRRVDSAGNISTFAEGGVRAVMAGARTPFLTPSAIIPDGAGGVYVADVWNVFRVDVQGNTRLVAGRFRECGYSGDGGPAPSAQVCQPWDAALDSGGNIFVADTNNNRVRRIDSRTGVITTVAGTGPTNGFEGYRQGGFSGDGGPATLARLNTPQGVLVDRNDVLFIADTGNARIRKVDRGGTITTVAGDIIASRMVMDAAGFLYVSGGTARADDPAVGVRRIDSASGAMTLLTRPGAGSAGPLGDGGPAAQARVAPVNAGSGLALDRDGNLFFVDSENFRVRAIRGAASPTAGAAGNHTALWWNPVESGWGLNVNHQGDTLFATLFTYDASGSPLWLVMSAGARQGSGEAFSGELYRTTGPAFNAVPFTPIGAGNITRVGNMSLDFSGATGTLTYSFQGVSVTKTIQKQQFGSRIATCAATTMDRAALGNYQDLWWNAAESGWGLNITHQDNTLFSTLFTYDLNGQGVWLVMPSGNRQVDGSFLGDLYRTTGPAFNARPFTPITASDITRVGTMSLRFATGTSGTVAYSVNGVNVTKAITRQVFSSPVPACA